MGRRMGSIGLDVGSFGCRAVQLAWTGTGVELVQVASLERPRRGDGKVKPAELAPVIAGFLRQHRFHGKEVATAVSHEDSVIRVVSMPLMSEEELGQAVRYEAERYIPFAPGDCVTDYAVLGETKAGGTPQLEVMLVAARRSSVEVLLEAVRKAGFRPVGVDAEALAAGRALLSKGVDGDREGAGNGAAGRSPLRVVCDIGHTYTNISVFRGKSLRIHRSVAVAGATMLDRAARTVGLESALPQAVFAGSAGQSRTVTPALAPVWEELVTELNRSIDFCRSQEGEQPAGVLLTGGAVRVPGLVAHLRERVAIPVEVANPVEGMTAGRSVAVAFLTEVVPELAVAVGLALRGLLVS